jgi:hypothetical protein
MRPLRTAYGGTRLCRLGGGCGERVLLDRGSVGRRPVQPAREVVSLERDHEEEVCHGGTSG